jgi:AcrR family transcriptional regulator
VTVNFAPMTDTEGLRERKKRLTRTRISDTATALFLNRGFEAVTVAEVARAAEVSEKTVYNYFPTKESLLLDQEADWTAALRAALGPGSDRPPVAVVVEVLAGRLRALLGLEPDGGPAVLPADAARGVAALIQRTPALRAANQELAERMIGVLAGALAQRSGLDPDAPEPQIAATALAGLWRVQFRSLARHAAAELPREEVFDLVLADVRRAAELLETGLRVV